MKVSYNHEDHIFLAINLNRNYDSSFQIGNFIFDLDKDNNICGIEIINLDSL